METIAQHGSLLIALAIILALFMTWGIGANDVANALGTSVGSGAINYRTAILLAAGFELAGAVLAGGRVTETIRRGIIDPTPIESSPEVLAFGMLAALLGAAIWLALATVRGWPVSTTHSIVGAVVGFGVVGVGLDAVAWGKLGQIAAGWLVSPLLGGAIAFALMHSIRRLILNTDRPFDNAVRWAPAYVFLVGFIVALVTLFRGLTHLQLELSVAASVLIALAIGLGCAVAGRYALGMREIELIGDRKAHFARVEAAFAPMMVFTACAMAFAHGSNDVANGVGPLAAVYGLVRSGGEIAQRSPLPLWILLLGGAGLVLGIATYGFRVMQTIGARITVLTPTRGFCATLAAAVTVVLASRTGMPVSTTHVVVGAVMGVGLARGIAALDLRVIVSIVIAWVVTLPAGGILAALIFFALRAVFS